MKSISKSSHFFNNLKKKRDELIYGKGNARLEFFLESYYKLNPEKQTILIISSLLIVLIGTITILAIYFSAMYKMQNDVEIAVENINKLNRIQNTYKDVDESYQRFIARVESATQSFSFLSMVDQKIKDLGLQVSDFPTQISPYDFSSLSPLAEKYQRATVEFKINRVSLKKIIQFINSISNSSSMIEVKSLEIQQIFENKLYFDVRIALEAFVPYQK
ncbi:MAG: hypothetical protein K2X39_06815 [Silvanigrellaceae bacterium]|nr:hypothetical protein [Silvanigrellaceae bacterium]